MGKKVYVNDIGTKIEIDAQESLAVRVLMNMQFQKPDGSTITKSEGDGVTIDPINPNKAFYITVTDDIDQAGQWQAHLYVEFSATEKFLSAMKQFRIHEKFK